MHKDNKITLKIKSVSNLVYSLLKSIQLFDITHAIFRNASLTFTGTSLTFRNCVFCLFITRQDKLQYLVTTAIVIMSLFTCLFTINFDLISIHRNERP